MIRTNLVSEKQLVTEEGIDASGSSTPIWVEAVSPTPQELASLAGRFGLHELALEDAMREGHPPKLEEFDDHLFLIVHTPVEIDEEDATRKIAMFVGKGWLVTILRQPLDSVDEVVKRLRRDPSRLALSPAAVAHMLLDYLTDGFEDRVTELSDQEEALADAVLERSETGLLTDILRMRRDSSALIRVVRSQRDVANALTRSSQSTIPAKLRPYLRDVSDHLARVSDQLDRLREGLVALREAQLSAQSQRLGERMGVLTVLTTTLLPLTLIVGIYGMNFETMPGTSDPAGFWWTMLVMALLAIGTLTWFRHRRWI